MTPRENKKNKLQTRKEGSDAEPWPDLPQHLLYSVGRQHNLRKIISFGSVCKSWRAAGKRCSSIATSPFLQLSDLNDANGDQYFRNKKNFYILSISFCKSGHYWYKRGPYRGGPRLQIFGCSHGLLVTSMNGIFPGDYSLVDFSSLFWSGWIFPSWDAKIPFKFATLSSFPSDPNGCSLMVLTGISCPAFVISPLRGQDVTWAKLDCTFVDPNCSKGEIIRFTNAIGFKGKFYALSLQGSLAIIENEGGEYRIGGLSKTRAVPSVTSRHFVEFMTETDGKILLIFLVSRKWISIVDGVEVFQLQPDLLSWKKLESLGDRTLFLGTNCCIAVTASQVGCRSNCVYFKDHKVDSWWEYDMGTGLISACCNSSGSVFSTKSPVWDVPAMEEQPFFA